MVERNKTDRNILDVQLGPAERWAERNEISLVGVSAEVGSEVGRRGLLFREPHCARSQVAPIPRPSSPLK